jgi:two-component system, NarL family, response regulator DesR
MLDDETRATEDVLSLLIVEDSDDVRYLVGSILSTEPRITIVAEAADANAALAAATQHQPDAIVLDVGLPGRSGMDIIPDLLAAAPRARIIVLSGDHRPELNAAVIAKGAYAYIAKRDAGSRLMAVVRSLNPSSATM